MSVYEGLSAVDAVVRHDVVVQPQDKNAAAGFLALFVTWIVHHLCGLAIKRFENFVRRGVWILLKDFYCVRS